MLASLRVETKRKHGREKRAKTGRQGGLALTGVLKIRPLAVDTVCGNPYILNIQKVGKESRNIACSG